MALVAERERLDRELANLAAAIAGGAEVPSLLVEMRRREARKRELVARMQRPSVDAVSLRIALAAKLADWKRLLRAHPAHGHRVLKTVLDGPITLGERTETGVRWAARGNLAGVFGETLYHQVASPAGFEPALPA